MSFRTSILLALSFLIQTLTGFVGADEIVDHKLIAPGQLVDVGGFRLHIHCLGKGEPTIVLDSGTGGFSLEWISIQRVMAKQTRICAYDRAGYGWSDMGPLPRTSKRIVNELHTLLTKSMIPGPYILAGHSFGGFTAQYFAKQYPQKIVALMLIDSSHPEQVDRLPRKDNHSSRSFPERSRTYTVSRTVLHEHYPKETASLAYQLMSSWKYRFTVEEEMQSLPQSAIEIRELQSMSPLPLVVLTRGKRIWPHNRLGDEMEKVWIQLQSELSDLSVNVVHLIAENSGHSIHLDQPGLVISALRDLLNTEALQ